MNKKINSSIVIVAVVVLVIAGGIFIMQSWQQQKNVKDNGVVCTQEAKLCPDGSYVGRSGPNCEFTLCPQVSQEGDSWKTATNSDLGVSFKYPETLTTTYIHPVDWPPQVQILNEPFACVEAGLEIARAGRTEKRTVDNRVYCRTIESEGAAGSTYTNYAYAFSKKNKTVILAFTLRSVQCDNYDDPQKTACKNERSSFDIDSVVDKMAQSIIIK